MSLPIRLSNATRSIRSSALLFKLTHYRNEITAGILKALTLVEKQNAHLKFPWPVDKLSLLSLYQL